MTDPLATSIIVASGSALTFLGQLFREWRNRKWDSEDRDRRAAEAATAASEHAAAIAADLAKTVKETAASVATLVAQSAVRAENLTRVRTDKVLDKIEENTQISVKAFTEANNVNAKLADLGVQIRDKKTETEATT